MEKQRPTRESELARSPKIAKLASMLSGKSKRVDNTRDVFAEDVVIQALKQLEDRDPIETKILELKVFKRMTFAEVASTLHLPVDTVHYKYSHSVRYLRRFLRGKQKIVSSLDVVESREAGSTNQVLKEMIERVTQVIGDRQEAMRWLGTPVRGLDYATPISLLGTDEGVTRVNDILGQIEHGVW
jgi:uncharacterized protein (DUF2384 family)